MTTAIMPCVQAILDLGTHTAKPLYWIAHSMGCYLFLNCLDRATYAATSAQGDAPTSTTLFSRVILSAPDVPTWFFVSTLSAAAAAGIAVAHYYHPDDQATEASRARRAIEGPCPGNAAVVQGAGIETVDCAGAKSASIGANMSLNHDYGRCDGYVLLDEVSCCYYC
jgi:esterase/lipase superfamily enzyme